MFSAQRSALSEGQQPSYPGPVSGGRSGLELRGEVGGVDVDLGGTGIRCHWCSQMWPLHRRNGSKPLLPGVAPEMGIWEVLGQHREAVGAMRQGGGQPVHQGGPLGLSPTGDPLRDWRFRAHIYSSGGLGGLFLVRRLFLRAQVSGPSRSCMCLWPEKGLRQRCRKLQELQDCHHWQMTFRAAQDAARPLMACATVSALGGAHLLVGREEPVFFCPYS